VSGNAYKPQPLDTRKIRAAASVGRVDRVKAILTTGFRITKRVGRERLALADRRIAYSNDISDHNLRRNL